MGLPESDQLDHLDLDQLATDYLLALSDHDSLDPLGLDRFVGDPFVCVFLGDFHPEFDFVADPRPGFGLLFSPAIPLY